MENAPRRGRAPWPKKPSLLIIFLNLHVFQLSITVLKMKFSIKNFFSKCDQIRRKLRIWSYLLKKSLMGNFVFCAVNFNKSCKVLPKCFWYFFKHRRLVAAENLHISQKTKICSKSTIKTLESNQWWRSVIFQC